MCLKMTAKNKKKRPHSWTDYNKMLQLHEEQMQHDPRNTKLTQRDTKWQQGSLMIAQRLEKGHKITSEICKRQDYNKQIGNEHIAM